MEKRFVSQHILLLLLIGHIPMLMYCRNSTEDLENLNPNKFVPLTCEEGFEFQAILTSYHQMENPAVAVAPDGTVYVAFVDFSTEEVSVSVAQYVPDQDVTIQSIESVLQKKSEKLHIAIDPDGKPHVVYRSEKTQTIRHAILDEGWKVEDIPLSESWFLPSFRISDEGDLYVSFFDNGSGSQNAGIYVATGIEENWDIELIAEIRKDKITEATNVFSSIRIGNDGIPRLTYFDLEGRYLNYAELTTSTWKIDTVSVSQDPLVSKGGLNSLALDRDNNPHVAYSVVLTEEPSSGG